MKKQSYKKLFPVIRKTLWLSSIKTSNLGKKPTTYVSTCVDFMNADTRKIYSQFNKNDAFLFCDSIRFHQTKDFNFIETRRVFEFENKQIDLWDCDFPSEHLKLFLHSNVVRMEIWHGNIDLKTILDSAPKHNQRLLRFGRRIQIFF